MLILDADAAMSIVSDGPGRNLLESYIDQCPRVISSEFLLLECSNAIRKFIRGGFTDTETGKDWLTKIESMVDEFYPIKPDAHEILTESLRLNHSPYDLHYLILAKRFNAEVVSLDKRFIDICVSEGLNISTIVDFPTN
ncbi:MAG: type II toxin-antitoxin system VapC family toxin [Coriobacteriia bacterium]|nr:type II toxin-antitoxin system VapC family toxin [Coriobacteriia bacterium]MCL2537635.1 type II toxin-antitoxin system VapC family toxin [Coriobacteriia bacterium]